MAAYILTDFKTCELLQACIVLRVLGKDSHLVEIVLLVFRDWQIEWIWTFSSTANCNAGLSLKKKKKYSRYFLILSPDLEVKWWGQVVG